jgi:transposase
MTNQTIDIITEQKFYSKEEIVELTGLSIHTLNNWIKEFKPHGNEIETGRQNRRAYSTNYLIRIFEATERKELINLVKPDQEPSTDELKPKKNLAKDEAEDKTSNFLIEAKNETIKELKSRIESLENQLKEKDSQLKTAQELVKNQQSLQLQQNGLLLSSKKTRNFLSWFGFRSKQEEADTTTVN